MSQPGLKCCGCAENKRKSEFSKSQFKKGNKRRCNLCIKTKKKPMSKLEILMSDKTSISYVEQMYQTLLEKEKKVQFAAQKLKEEELKQEQQLKQQRLQQKMEEENKTYIDNQQSKRHKKKNRSHIYKVGVDENVYFGDGGELEMIWSIYVCDKLDVDHQKVNTLKKELIEIGLKNNDWRKDEPILNIIDPDLYVLKQYKKSGKEQETTESDKKLIAMRYGIRTEYQWIATEFKYNNKIWLKSTIHNLSPRSIYSSIYSGIEHIFTCMLPLFNQFEIFSKSNQVIIKSQRYEIHDMSGYVGYWHQEGLTENIVLVGLYYFELNDGITNGSLRFRNIESPSRGYEENLKKRGKRLVHDIAINEEGTAIVFDNVNLVHRVRMIKNKMNDKQKRYRSFIAFFIIDPNKPIQTTKRYPTLKREDYIKIIMVVIHCSLDIATLICQYGVCGITLEEAKEMREKDINFRKNDKTKGRFGTYHWGNCGERVFYHQGKNNEDAYVQWEDDWSTTTKSEISTNDESKKNNKNKDIKIGLAQY